MKRNALTTYRNSAPTLFDTVFDDFFNFPMFNESRMSNVNVDVLDYDDKMELVADIPGYTKEDIDIKYEKGYLTVSGKVEKNIENDAKYLHREIRSREFSRSFYLGDRIDSENIEAKYENGLLTIILPKSEKEVLKQISIQ